MTTANKSKTQFEWTKFLKGKVEILQPSKGARFSIDSAILAGLTFVREGESVIDLGCGSGVIMVLMSHFFHPQKLVGIDINEEFCHCAKESLLRSGFKDYEIINGDFRKNPEEKYDVVVSNPPFFETGKGKKSPDLLRDIYRHRENMDLATFFESAKNYLKEEGRLSFILPFSMKKEIFESLSKCSLFPYLTRSIRHKKDGEFILFLCLCSKKERRLIELPPLTIKNDEENYTEELKEILGEIPVRKEPSFFCDSMLYRLAKYLRFSGIDAAYLKDADDNWLLGECERSGRILLSLDRELINRFKRKGIRCFEPSSFNPKEQFREILNHFSIKENNPRRCLKCNAKVMKVDKEKIEGLVPEFTFKNQKDFYVCPSCSKITWGGTHLKRFKNDVLSFLVQGEER